MDNVDKWSSTEHLPQAGSRADAKRCVYCGYWHAGGLEERGGEVACQDQEWCAMRARKRRGPDARVPGGER